MSLSSTNPKSKKWLWVLTFITFFAFHIRLDPIAPDISEDTILPLWLYNSLCSVKPFSMERITLFPALYFLFAAVLKKVETLRFEWTVALPVTMFSTFMVLGYSFIQVGDWHLVLNVHNGQLAKSAVVFLGYWILFYFAVRGLYALMDRTPQSDTITIRKGILGRYLTLLEKHPFATAFVTLLLSFLPNIILNYPIAFMGDVHSELLQMYPDLCGDHFYYIARDHMLSPDVVLNQHHPVAHTLFLHLLLEISRHLFGDFQAGLLACNLIQSTLTITAYAFAVHVLMRRYHVSSRTGALVVLYGVCSPLMRDFISVLTKDSYYMPIFLLMVLSLLPLIEGKMTRREIAALVVFGTLTMMLRNDAKFIVIFGIILIALTCKQSRKYALPFLAYTLVFCFLYFNVLMVAIKATPGSRREMLSVPFQQTARYLRDHGDDVTEEEHLAIDAILDYDNLAALYSGDKSDPVKATFNEDATSEEMKNYFIAWINMLFRHPGTYVQATMNNYYKYFYPDNVTLGYYTPEFSVERMEVTNEVIEEGLGIRVSHPQKLHRLTVKLFHTWEKLITLPGLNVILVPALYSWTLILMFFYILRKRFGFAYWAMLFLSFGICLLGPCNGYYSRYQYPITLIIPIVLVVYYTQLHRQASEQHQQEA